MLPEQPVDAALPIPPSERTPFNFENTLRNLKLEEEAQILAPKARKTGTTIAGCVFKGGVVLGGDTRSGSDTIGIKNWQKIFEVAPNIWCCGSGTASDCYNMGMMVRCHLALQRLNTGKQSRVVEAETVLKRELFKYQGFVSAYMIIAGVDVTGPQLTRVSARGHWERTPYATDGSGSFAAMSAMEDGFKDDMTEKEAIELVRSAILRGVFEDLGSGNGIDICVVRKDGAELLPRFEIETPTKASKAYTFPLGSTVILKETVKMLNPDAMQTD